MHVPVRYSCPSSPRGATWRQTQLDAVGSHHSREAPSLGDPKLFNGLHTNLSNNCPGWRHYYTGQQIICLLLQRHLDHLCCLRLFTIQTALKKYPRIKSVSTSAERMCRNVRYPWIIVFQHGVIFSAQMV